MPAVLTLEPGLSAKSRSCWRKYHRTANAAEQDQMRLMMGACTTANVAEVADGEWTVITPYGLHPSPDRTYWQHFFRPEAEAMVRTWNSLMGVAFRYTKNARHGRFGVSTVPVFDGHSDSDAKRWPKERILADITDLRAGENGLEGRVQWNPKTANSRTPGPLYASGLFWHMPPAGNPPTVIPEILESVGLVPKPNIAAPAWTANATLAGEAAENQPTENNAMMLLERLRALFGLDAEANEDAAFAAAQTANAAQVQLAELQPALTTANSQNAEMSTQLETVRGELTTANGQVQALTTTNGELTTTNAALTTTVEQLREGVLDHALRAGAITPAERPNFLAKLTTGNAADVLTELRGRKAMNVTAIQLGGKKVDITTANARQEVVQAEVNRLMTETPTLSYDEAYAKVQNDPQFAECFAAMKQPEKAA